MVHCRTTNPLFILMSSHHLSPGFPEMGIQCFWSLVPFARQYHMLIGMCLWSNPCSLASGSCQSLRSCRYFPSMWTSTRRVPGLHTDRGTRGRSKWFPVTITRWCQPYAWPRRKTCERDFNKLVCPSLSISSGANDRLRLSSPALTGTIWFLLCARH